MYCKDWNLYVRLSLVCVPYFILSSFTVFFFNSSALFATYSCFIFLSNRVKSMEYNQMYNYNYNQYYQQYHNYYAQWGYDQNTGSYSYSYPQYGYTQSTMQVGEHDVRALQRSVSTETRWSLKKRAINTFPHQVLGSYWSCLMRRQN